MPIVIRRRAAIALLAAASLVPLAACSSSSDGTTSSDTKATSTTAKVDDRGTDAAYAKRGPHEVGTYTTALGDGRRVVIWYPADASAAKAPTETFDIASLLSPQLQSQIPAELRPQYPIAAHPGAKAASGGPFPIVLFSHGFAGFPEQSADLVTHLASWGFVVVAPDHVERSLSGLLGGAGKGVPKLADDQVLSQSLDLALAEAKKADSPIHDLVDASKVAVTGHSAGAAAAFETASKDDRIKAFISYSVGFGGQGGPMPTPPKVPGMVMLGQTDGIIPADANRKVYEAMNTPKYKVEIANAGHLVFSDICEIGREQGGLSGLVKQAGLNIPDNLLRLAKDGCGPKDLRPPKAFPAIDHLSVAFLRNALGIDREPIGLDPAVTKNFTDADVTLTADPG